MKVTKLIIAVLTSVLLFIPIAVGQNSYMYSNAYTGWGYAGGMYSDFGYYNATASVSGSMPPGGIYCPGGYCDQTSISTSTRTSISASSQASYNWCGCNPWDLWCSCYPYYAPGYYYTPSYYYFTPSYYYYYTPSYYYYTPGYYYIPAYYYTARYYYFTPSYYYYYTPITWYSYYPTGPVTTFSYQQSTTIRQGTTMGY